MVALPTDNKERIVFIALFAWIKFGSNRIFRVKRKYIAFGGKKNLQQKVVQGKLGYKNSSVPKERCYENKSDTHMIGIEHGLIKDIQYRIIYWHQLFVIVQIDPEIQTPFLPPPPYVYFSMDSIFFGSGRLLSEWNACKTAIILRFRCLISIISFFNLSDRKKKRHLILRQQ